MYERRWNDVDRGTLKNWEKMCPNVTSSANPTGTDTGANSGLSVRAIRAQLDALQSHLQCEVKVSFCVWSIKNSLKICVEVEILYAFVI
jgi:hypothetical protein